MSTSRHPAPGSRLLVQEPATRAAPTRLPPEDRGFDIITFTVADLASVPRPKPSALEAIPVPASLRDPHPLVASLLNDARTAKVDEGGHLVLASTRSIRVSRENFDRVLRIVDALFKASEREERVRWTFGKESALTVDWKGVRMKVRISERIERIERPRAPQPVRPGRAREPDFSPTTYRFAPSNLIAFGIDDPMESTAQRNWSDTATRKLEEKLAHIIAGLPLVANAVQALRDKWAAHERERAEERRREKAAARSAEIKRRRRAALSAAVTSWERAESIRRFCAAAKTRIAKIPDADRDSVDAWIYWAERQADMLDPLITRLGRLAAAKVRLPDYYTGPQHWEKTDPGWWARE